MDTFDIQFIFIGNVVCPVLFIYKRDLPPLASWFSETNFIDVYTLHNVRKKLLQLGERLRDN